VVPTTRLFNKLSSLTTLTDSDRALLLALRGTVIALKAGEDVGVQGDRPQDATLVLKGVLGRYKLLSNGRRQFLSFDIPGDMPDLQSLYLETLDSSLGALTDSEVMLIPLQEIHSILGQSSELNRVFARVMLVEAAIFREWMVNLGRRTAFERIGHLLCEMMTRMRAVGLTNGDSCELHITQSQIADALGLSLVHINRTLRELREAGLIGWSRGILTVLNWHELCETSGFEGSYLRQVTQTARDR
jgi:CRP-like cAMP-binding protein